MKNKNYEGMEELEDFRSEFNPLSKHGIFYSGSGGSSSPDTTTTISKTEPPDYVKPYSVELMERAGAMSNDPYQYYSGQRIAGLEPEHYYGLDNTSQRAMEGSQVVNSAQEHATNVLGGDYLNRGLDLANQQNPYQGQANPYSGENPMMENMINRAQAGITQNYTDTVNPMLASMDRGSGAFGNSGVQHTRNRSQEQLLAQLGDTENQMRFQDYGQQAQLAESGLNRNAQLAQQQQANTLNMYGNERENQMNAIGQAGGLAEQDYIDAQNLLGVGDIYRNASQQQLDYGYDQWQQEQNHPYQQLDLLSNAIRTSMGGGGTNVTSAPNAYSPNSTAQMIGTGVAGYGALQGLLG